MQGWIKLHRVLLEKAIWKNSNLAQRSILISLLLMANHKENEWLWKGQKYKCNSGEFITSINSIIKANDNMVTRQQVRTALVKFEKLGFLTTESTKTSTKITLLNWGKYQVSQTECNQVSNQQVTNNQPTGNQQVTTNKNERREECKNKNHISRNDDDEFISDRHKRLMQMID